MKLDLNESENMNKGAREENHCKQQHLFFTDGECVVGKLQMFRNKIGLHVLHKHQYVGLIEREKMMEKRRL